MSALPVTTTMIWGRLFNPSNCYLYVGVKKECSEIIVEDLNENMCKYLTYSEYYSVNISFKKTKQEPWEL